MSRTDTLPNVLAISSLKGGVGKSAGVLGVGSAMALADRGLEVAILALDSNDSTHDRFVQYHHRQPTTEEATLAMLLPDALPDDRRLNWILDQGDPLSPELVRRFLYRRDDAPNLGALFHTAGTLTQLSVRYISDSRFRGRYHELLDGLSAAADIVLVDTPADLEALLVSETLRRATAVLAATDLSAGGVRSTVTLADLALVEDIPLAGVLLSPDDYSRSNVLQQARRDVSRLCEALELRLLPIRRDATVGKAERYCTPVPLLHAGADADRLRLTGYANDGYAAAASWLTSLLADPELLLRRWAATRAAARSLQNVATVSEV